MTDIQEMDRLWQNRLGLSDETWASMSDKEREQRQAVWVEELLRRQAEERKIVEAAVQKMKNYVAFGTTEPQPKLKFWVPNETFSSIVFGSLVLVLVATSLALLPWSPSAVVTVIVSVFVSLVCWVWFTAARLRVSLKFRIPMYEVTIKRRAKHEIH